jgi:F0F1-type ATP synthase membrane subunit b/b'
MTEHGAHVAPSISELLWPAVNFTIFVLLLVRFLRGPVAEYFRARTARLREGLQAGARARDEAAALRAQLARDIENLPAARAQLRADLRTAAEHEGRGLIALGQKAAERIRTDARLLADHEFTTAREALRAEVIDEAVSQATALIRRALQPQDQERFMRDFVASAGGTAGGRV